MTQTQASSGVQLSPEALALLQLIQDAGSQGTSVAQLLAQLPELSRRTAQRWLAQFVQDGRIAATGVRRGRRYYSKRPSQSVAPMGIAAGVAEPAASAPQAVTHLQLAPDALEVRDYVLQPLEQRKPVGYQRELLDSYQPNQTFYLPATVRRQLHAQG